MNVSFLVLLSLLLGGGSGDLLDYVQTQGYWDSHDVHVTLESMLQEATPPPPADISKLIADLGANDPQTRDAAAVNIFKTGAPALPALIEAAKGTDPEIADRSQFLIHQLRPLVTQAAVRRLLALRTLGELKDPKAIPFLQAQLASQEMFVADYARAAIGKIKNQPVIRNISEGTLDEVWMLPANCRAVLQVIPRQTGPINLADAAGRFHPPHGPDGATVLANVSRVALSVAEAMGDMRLDSLNVGLSENIDDHHGCVTLIASGEFDSADAVRAARGHDAAMRTVDGVDIFEIGPDATMFFPSDHELVLMISPMGQDLPLVEMLEAVKTRGQPLKHSPEMSALVQPMLVPPSKRPHAVWLAAKVTDAYRKVPWIGGFNTLTLTSDQAKDAINYTIHGECTDGPVATTMSEKLNGDAALAIASFKARQEIDAEDQAAIDFLNTIKFQNDGTGVNGAASLPQTADAILTRLMIFSSLGTGRGDILR